MTQLLCAIILFCGSAEVAAAVVAVLAVAAFVDTVDDDGE